MIPGTKSKEICMYCVNFYFDSGSPTYSELTPGSNWYACCELDNWDLSGNDYPTQEEFVQKLNSTCSKWEERKV